MLRRAFEDCALTTDVMTGFPGETQAEFELRPVGYGVQKVPEILEAATASGAQWIVVEQDEPSMGKTPMECAAMSREYLKTLGQ